MLNQLRAPDSSHMLLRPIFFVFQLFFVRQLCPSHVIVSLDYRPLVPAIAGVAVL